MPQAPLTVSIPEALDSIGAHATALGERAALDGGPLLRAWIPEAGTWLYQVRAEARGGVDLLDAAVAALLGERPGWFPGLRGRQATELDPPAGAERARHSWTHFHIGFGQVRLYEQVLGLVVPDPHTRVITQRSVHSEGGPDDKRAYTLAPSGDVLRLVGDRVILDHIGTAPGGGLLPPTADRWLTNLVRRLGLDGAERGVYLREGEAFTAWAAALPASSRRRPSGASSAAR